MLIIRRLIRLFQVFYCAVLLMKHLFDMDDSDSRSLDCSDIQSELSSIKTSIQEVLRYLSDAQTFQQALSTRIASLESQREARGSSCHSGRDNCRWICPVCWKPFAHRESFKGHIRRLTESPTDRMHCCLDPERPEHVALLSHSRYGNGDFSSRAAAFASQLYDTVKSHSNSTRTSASSHSAVSYAMLQLLMLDLALSCVPSGHIECLFNRCIRLWLGLKKAIAQHFLLKLLNDIDFSFLWCPRMML